jgi:hypothetical protein
MATQLAGILYRPLAAALVPFTGWVWEAPYLFSVVVIVRFWRSDRARSCRLAMLGMGFASVIEGIDWWLEAGAREHSNPWLHVQELRPVCTILLPLVWLGVLWLTYGIPASAARPRLDPA